MCKIKKNQFMMTQQEIADTVNCSQAYIHYIFNGDRIPSPQMAIKLEMITGVCREAWTWPERHFNPYIPFSDLTVCGGCPNKIHLIKKTNEVYIEIFKKASDKKLAFKEMIVATNNFFKLPPGRIIIFREISSNKLELLATSELNKSEKRLKILSGKPYKIVIETALQGRLIAVPHWPHDLPSNHAKIIHDLGLEPKSYYRISSGRHLTMTLIAQNDTMIFHKNVIDEYQSFINHLDEIWHIEKTKTY